jgi:hypothetical protein
MTRRNTVQIQDGTYEVAEHGLTVIVSASPHYSKIKINDVDLYFVPETGEFDGWAVEAKTGPVLVRSAP